MGPVGRGDVARVDVARGFARKFCTALSEMTRFSFVQYSVQCFCSVLFSAGKNTHVAVLFLANIDQENISKTA